MQIKTVSPANWRKTLLIHQYFYLIFQFNFTVASWFRVLWSILPWYKLFMGQVNPYFLWLNYFPWLLFFFYRGRGGDKKEFISSHQSVASFIKPAAIFMILNIPTLSKFDLIYWQSYICFWHQVQLLFFLNKFVTDTKWQNRFSN